MKLYNLFKTVLFFAFIFTYSLRVQAQEKVRTALHDSLYGKIQFHLSNGDIDSALIVSDLLYRHYTERDDQMEIVRSRVHKAEILRTIVSLDLAFESLKEVQKLNESLEPSTVKSYYYNRLGAIEYERKNYDAAIAAVKESQKIDELKNYKWRIFSNLNILGAIYRDREQWDQSVEILRKAYEEAKSLNDTAEMYLSLKNLGMAQYRMGDYRGAINSAKLYSNYDWISYDRMNVSDNFRLVAKAYAELGIMDSAFMSLDSAHKHTLDGMQAIVDKRTDNFRIANELDNQKLENSVLIAEKEKSQLQSLMLIIVLILIILLAIVFFRQKQGYKKLNAKQQELNQALEKSLGFKDQLIGIVAHDIRNPMSSLTGVIHLYNEGLIGRDDLKEMMSKLEASAVSVNFLIENLLNWVLNQKQALVANLQPFNISKLIDKTMKEVEAQSKSKGLSIQVYGFKANLELNSDEMMLGLVIRNLLSNAIKFSFNNAEIIVSYKEDVSGHHVVIKDFGVGMSTELLQRVSGGMKETQEGTSHEKGTGLGLELSREFLKAIGGSLVIKSEKGKGTEIDIVLPLN